ncbi:MAG: ABC transporter permease, partial [Clostridiales bacterium]|nr:ABC transporter permease [Clostridiales bacterium]
CAVGLCLILCSILGWIYGKLMNAVQGAEMTIATYSGFSIVALFNILWLAVPFSNRKMGWMLGTGLRETIQLDNFGASQIISNLGSFSIGKITVPTGAVLVFVLGLVLINVFFNSKTGLAIYAGGENPRFADAAGLNIKRGRLLANMLSTILAGLGIILYAQEYGYVQLYNGPMNMAFPAVAAVLVGGATASKASVRNVVIGVIIFQGLMTAAMPVANQIFTGTDLSDIMRIIIQNGVILYALTKVKAGGDH